MYNKTTTNAKVVVVLNFHIVNISFAYSFYAFYLYKLDSILFFGICSQNIHLRRDYKFS